ncbi:hypothetical protein QBC40DRAFT_84621 [Triangularia verruculosa]|uniref:Uncharacterized protein n=1 Tax=Triangularia verruculosa TaxID=2587418 RepID=A0AAN7AS89_9PEZI|nr:hypothetical protein QBC40DRAFT_84621 [Triangularia verruculosa]
MSIGGCFCKYISQTFGLLLLLLTIHARGHHPVPSMNFPVPFKHLPDAIPIVQNLEVMLGKLPPASFSSVTP